MRSALSAGLAALAAADPLYVGGVLALYVISLFLVGARWRVFVRAVGGDVSIWRATLANLGGIAAGNLSPATRVGGEACRIALVRQSGTVTWRQATIAAAWDRLAELPPVAALAAVSVVVLREFIPASRSWALAIGAVAVLIAVIVGLKVLARASHRLREWADYLAADRVSAATYSAGAMLASLMWIQDVLRLACATRAVGLSLPAGKLAAVSMLGMLGGLVPGVAGLGPVEASLAAGLLAFGASPADAVAATAIERVISYGFSTAAGALTIAVVSGRSVWTAIRQPPSALTDVADL
jgi:uncharacterized membrane protein YbhN (UPF0104 family)